MNYDNQSFKDQTVELSGNRFHGCTFERCKLVYRGDISPTFNDNHCIESAFVFADAAIRTIYFLSNIYHAARAAAKWWKIPSSVFGSVPFMAWWPARSRRTHKITAWSLNRIDGTSCAARGENQSLISGTPTRHAMAPRFGSQWCLRTRPAHARANCSPVGVTSITAMSVMMRFTTRSPVRGSVHLRLIFDAPVFAQ